MLIVKSYLIILYRHLVFDNLECGNFGFPYNSTNEVTFLGDFAITATTVIKIKNIFAQNGQWNGPSAINGYGNYEMH